MQVEIVEAQWSIQSGAHIAVHGTDMEGCHLAVSFIACDTVYNVDLTILDALSLRDELTRAINEVFSKVDSIKCPACGYTRHHAGIHGDHKLCRRYPFFPDETGESEAINR